MPLAIRCLLFVTIPTALAIQPPTQPGHSPQDPGDTVSVRGQVDAPLDLQIADLAKMTRKTVSATDHDGHVSQYEGVALSEVLKRAGVNHGAPLRGGALTTFLLVEARDGYRVLFALPELDEAFTEHVVLLADHRDGKPLVHPEGPFRLVVPHEKKAARWVRQVTQLTVHKLPPMPDTTSNTEAKPGF